MGIIRRVVRTVLPIGILPCSLPPQPRLRIPRCCATSTMIKRRRLKSNMSRCSAGRKLRFTTLLMRVRRAVWFLLTW